MQLTEAIQKYLENHPQIRLGIIYGSLAKNRQSFTSDIDLGVAANHSLSSDETIELIEDLTDISERPVDLIDLQATDGTLLKQILTTGTVVYCSDTQLYANIIKRMLFNEADMMPYHYRILKEQRQRWTRK